MIVSVRIPRRSRKCCSCSLMFTPGTEYASLLSEGHKEGEYERADYCLRCWGEQLSDRSRTYWKGKVPKRKAIAEDPEEHYLEVFEFLHEEIEKNTREADQSAFLLSLYLLRKKKIALRQEMDREDGVYQIYEILSTEEMFSVKKQTLSEERLLSIQQELQNRFAWK